MKIIIKEKYAIRIMGENCIGTVKLLTKSQADLIDELCDDLSGSTECMEIRRYDLLDEREKKNWNVK